MAATGGAMKKAYQLMAVSLFHTKPLLVSNEHIAPLQFFTQNREHGQKQDLKVTGVLIHTA